MAKIKIITDSGSDISPSVAEKLNIRILPISFTFDGENYFKENIDISLEEFYSKLSDKDAPVPKTAQVTPIQFSDAYNEEYDNGYDTLIVVTISSKGSGMYQNAVLSAQEVMDERGGEIIVIDSLAYSCLYGAPVINGAKMLMSGKGKNEVVEYLTDAIQSMEAYFIVDDLLHLKKGGRINSATLVLANMLDIKPILGLKDGLVVQDGKLRGNKKLMKKLLDKAKSDGVDLTDKSIFLVNTSCSERITELKDEIESSFSGVKCIEIQVGSIIACHAGPSLAGFVFSKKYDFFEYED